MFNNKQEISLSESKTERGGGRLDCGLLVRNIGVLSIHHVKIIYEIGM